MKVLRRIALGIGWVVMVYTLVSVGASVIFNTCPTMAENVKLHRAPLLLVEIEEATVVLEDDGTLRGDGIRGYIGYRTMGHAPGDVITSVFLYSPFNNECDDILERWDFKRN